MPVNEQVERFFTDQKVADVHVNVGHFSVDGSTIVDGDLASEHVIRQFDAEALAEHTNLLHIGLRTHYSSVELPPGSEQLFVPSVALNWIGVDARRLEQELRRFERTNISPIVWFQSFRDPYHRSVIDEKYKQAIGAGGEEKLVVSHTDENGELTISCLEVLEVARDCRAVIATPHSNWQRTVPLIERAVEMGLNVLWVHPDSRLIRTPLNVQQEVAERAKGRVFVERAAVFLRDGKVGAYSAETIKSDVRTIGIDYLIFSSDLGRNKLTDPLFPDQGLLWYVNQLMEAGLTIQEIEMALVINPERYLKGNI